MHLRIGSKLLLSLILLTGLTTLVLRAQDFWGEISSGRLLAPEAQAQTPSPKDAPAAQKASAAAAGDAQKATPAPLNAPSAPSPSAAELTVPDDASPAEIEVLKQLSNRRQELDKRSQALDAREGLLRVAEQRVDQKLKDMETLRKQLQTMVNSANEAQAAQLDNLVKIYETMKPKDAARIFEALDMPILLSVVQRMKPARTAPIMAEMAPDKAKEVTVALTKQDKLPQIK